MAVAGMIAAATLAGLGSALPSEAGALPSRAGPWVVASDGQRVAVAGFVVRRDRPGRAAAVGPAGLLPNRPVNVTLRQAMRRWGAPARIGRPGGSGVDFCLGIWRRPQLRVGLANLGFAGPGTSACTPGVGKVQEIVTVGPRWRTDRGLRVGDTPAGVRALYPRAVRQRIPGLGVTWLLLPRRALCIGVCEAETVLASPVIAETRDGRVSGSLVRVGGAGE